MPAFTSELAEYLSGEALERFERYVRVDTQAARERTGCPSTPGQLDLGRLLVEKLKEVGLGDAALDDNRYVTATLPQARSLVRELSGRKSPARFLIRDNDAKFSGAFDGVFRAEGIEIIRTPVEAPKADAIAERFVGTIRREGLDRVLIADRRHLERVLRTFVDHYNGHRPHRGLDLAAPAHAKVVPLPSGASNIERVGRRARLGGLINEYRIAALTALESRFAGSGSAVLKRAGSSTTTTPTPQLDRRQASDQSRS